jgi:hypothetical protein
VAQVVDSDARHFAFGEGRFQQLTMLGIRRVDLAAVVREDEIALPRIGQSRIGTSSLGMETILYFPALGAAQTTPFDLGSGVETRGQPASLDWPSSRCRYYRTCRSRGLRGQGE